MYEVIEDGGRLVLGERQGDGSIKVTWKLDGSPTPANIAKALEMRERLNEGAAVRKNVFDPQEDRDNEDAPRLDGGSWKPATETSDDEAQDVVGQPLDLPVPGEGPREL